MGGSLKLYPERSEAQSRNLMKIVIARPAKQAVAISNPVILSEAQRSRRIWPPTVINVTIRSCPNTTFIL